MAPLNRRRPAGRMNGVAQAAATVIDAVAMKARRVKSRLPGGLARAALIQ
jgi:hypothetical protein